MSDKLILKVQLPLMSSGGGAPMALYYSENRLVQGFLPLTKFLEKRMDGKLKRYFYAEQDSKGAVVLLKYAPWQDW